MFGKANISSDFKGVPFRKRPFCLMGELGVRLSFAAHVHFYHRGCAKTTRSFKHESHFTIGDEGRGTVMTFGLLKMTLILYYKQQVLE